MTHIKYDYQKSNFYFDASEILRKAIDIFPTGYVYFLKGTHENIGPIYSMQEGETKNVDDVKIKFQGALMTVKEARENVYILEDFYNTNSNLLKIYTPEEE